MCKLLQEGRPLATDAEIEVNDMDAGSCAAGNFIKKCLRCGEVGELEHGREVGERLVSPELEGNIEWRGGTGGTVVAFGEREKEGLLEVGGRAEEGLPERGSW